MVRQTGIINSLVARTGIHLVTLCMPANKEQHNKNRRLIFQGALRTSDQDIVRSGERTLH